MERTMEASTRNIKVLSNAKGLSARTGMIPVLRSLDRHQVYNQLAAKLDLNRAENAKWQLADAVYLTTTSVIAGA
jgi:hypothetical protein